MTVKIYAMTHKQFEQPQNEMYVPMQVGRAVHEDLGYLRDDTGDHISALNCYYAELTGVYWLWKNMKQVDYIGICHYRRYLLNQKGKMFTESELLNLFNKQHYDMLTTKKVILDCSYYEGFSGKHNINDLIETERVIAERYPEYLLTYQRLVRENKTYFGNMMIASKKTYDAYVSWLFGIFQILQERIDPSQYDQYRMRVYGFISEFLLYVWVTHNKLKVLECDVAVIGEKKETKETKEKLANYFEKKDVMGAKAFFWQVYQQRPDVLMEASDFDGSLKLAMQAISTAEYEQKAGEISVIEKFGNFEQTISYYKKLNKIMGCIKTGQATSQDWISLNDMKVSESAIWIAVQLLCRNEQEVTTIIKKLKMQGFLKKKTMDALLMTC